MAGGAGTYLTGKSLRDAWANPELQLLFSSAHCCIVVYYAVAHLSFCPLRCFGQGRLCAGPRDRSVATTAGWAWVAMDFEGGPALTSHETPMSDKCYIWLTGISSDQRIALDPSHVTVPAFGSVFDDSTCENVIPGS